MHRLWTITMDNALLMDLNHGRALQKRILEQSTGAQGGKGDSGSGLGSGLGSRLGMGQVSTHAMMGHVVGHGLVHSRVH